MVLDKCNVSLGQQVNNCCPLRPAAYINKFCNALLVLKSIYKKFTMKPYTTKLRCFYFWRPETEKPERWRFYSLVTRLLRDQIQYGGQCAIPRSNAKSCKFINSDFRAFCLKKYTINREDMRVKLKYNYSSKFWLF